jgi:hypothetical protein
MRNMSFSATKEQFRARTKTVTRRMGWTSLRIGETVMAIEKGQGLKKGEKIVKLGPIRIVGVRRERLAEVTQEDVIAEGFPDQTPQQFVQFFCEYNGCQPDQVVTRIKFEYLTTTTTDDDSSAPLTAALPAADAAETPPAEAAPAVVND